jgi:phosphoglycolate phosphatase-like HAD superfamily hydrolase
MGENNIQAGSGRASPVGWRDADAYLFDIDGTLLVTRDRVHWKSLHQAMLEAYGVDTTIEGIPYHGMTDLGILRAALARVGIAGLTFDMKLPYALSIVRREVETNRQWIVPEVCPAIPQLLVRLTAENKLLGIASGNLEAVGWNKLQAAGLRQYFAFGCFSDHSESRTAIFQQAVAEVRHRLGAPAKACFVGDTPEDIWAARRVDASIIAVSTGSFTSPELSSHHPDACVASCAELLADFSPRPQEPA